MADWRINEKYRKPRVAKGTPFYVHRNYYALGIIAFGAVSWCLYELWPAAKRLKKTQLEDKFKNPEGLEIKRKHMQLSRMSPHMDELLTKTREREASKYEDNSKPQSWLSKVLTSEPDI